MNSINTSKILAKKHHFVPQVYLKQFASNELADKCFIYQLIKDSKKILEVNIRKTAFKENLYTNELEKYFADELENKFNKIFNDQFLKKTIKRETQDIPINLKGKIAELIISQYLRNERIVKFVENTTNKVNMELSNTGFSFDYKKIFEQRFYYLFNMMKNELIQNISWNWVFLIADRGSQFITSNIPVCFINHNDLEIKPKKLDAFMLHSEIFLPINKNLVIWLYKFIPDYKKGVIYLDKNQVKFVNEQSYLNGDIIYSSNKSLLTSLIR